MLADPPGSIAQVTVWSTPALGLAVTVTMAVSEQPLAFVQMKLYVPAAVNVIVVAGLVGVLMVAGLGFDACAVHVPVPVAAIVAVLLSGKHGTI